jgi:hypothetical protein
MLPARRTWRPRSSPRTWTCPTAIRPAVTTATATVPIATTETTTTVIATAEPIVSQMEMDATVKRGIAGGGTGVGHVRAGMLTRKKM